MTREQKFFNDIDWKELREQKLILINMIQDWGEADDQDQRNDAFKVEGIIYFIDAIQDYAVGELGMDENVVFNFKG